MKIFDNLRTTLSECSQSANKREQIAFIAGATKVIAIGIGLGACLCTLRSAKQTLPKILGGMGGALGSRDLYQMAHNLDQMASAEVRIKKIASHILPPMEEDIFILCLTNHTWVVGPILEICGK